MTDDMRRSQRLATGDADELKAASERLADTSSYETTYPGDRDRRVGLIIRDATWLARHYLSLRDRLRADEDRLQWAARSAILAGYCFAAGEMTADQFRERLAELQNAIDPPAMTPEVPRGPDPAG